MLVLKGLGIPRFEGGLVIYRTFVLHALSEFGFVGFIGLKDNS